MEQHYSVLGIMSGTSLDGLDLALCHFNYSDHWAFRIEKASTFKYSPSWKKILSEVGSGTAFDLVQNHKQYGKFIGEKIIEFLKGIKKNPKFIASHGHTIFHQPEKHITFQLGCGAMIAATSGVTTISDFRTSDVALSGQGAPLVPIGDELLFGEYDYCLNLGGFANISFRNNNKRIAFDICPVNILLNFLMEKRGLVYDEDGKEGRKGKVDAKLLDQLNRLEFYHLTGPKSLGREWLETHCLPLVEDCKLDFHDLLRTVYEHISIQIAQASKNRQKKMLVTGGGVHNSFLIKNIKQHSKNQVIIPDQLTIDFKEALIFAFLGVLRIRNENNCLASVTGAKRDNCGGVVYGF